jgi:DNA repair protein RadC
MLEKKPESEAGAAEAAPHYHGHRERLRARFREAGADALSDYELLELLLFRVMPRRDVKPLAKALVAKFGSFAEAIAAPAARLAEVKRLGEACITEFKIVQAADIQMTQQIMAVASPLGISVHDHIVVGKEGHASLKGLKLI